jgi:hypothetical protein
MAPTIRAVVTQQPIIIKENGGGGMIRTIACGLLIMFWSFALLAKKDESSKKECTPGSIREMDSKTAKEVGKFLIELQSAVEDDDTQRVASMVRYPLKVNSMNGSYLVHDREQLIRKYTTIFSPGIKKILMAQRPECVNVFSQGFMIDTGEIWFGASAPDQPIKVISVNPPIPPTKP